MQLKYSLILVLMGTHLLPETRQSYSTDQEWKDYEIEAFNDAENAFWTYSQKIELDASFNSPLTGRTEILLEKLKDNAQTIMFGFDLKENEVEEVEVRASWNQTKSKPIQIMHKDRFLSHHKLSRITLHPSSSKNKKFTLEIRWKRLENNGKSLSFGNYKHGYVFAFQRGCYERFYPFVNTSQMLTKFQLRVTLNNEKPFQKLGSEMLVISNSPLLEQDQRSGSFLFEMSKASMLPHQLAFALLKKSGTWSFHCIADEHTKFPKGLHFFAVGVTQLSYELLYEKDVICDAVNLAVKFCEENLPSKVMMERINFLIMDEFTEPVSFRPGFVKIKAAASFVDVIEPIIYAVARHWTHGMTSLYDEYDVWFEIGLTHFVKLKILNLFVENSGYRNFASVSSLYLLSAEPEMIVNSEFKKYYHLLGYDVAEKRPELMMHGALTFANLDLVLRGNLLKCVKLFSYTESKTGRAWWVKTSYLMQLVGCLSKVSSDNLDGEFLISYLLQWFHINTVPVLKLHSDGTNSSQLRATHEVLCVRNYPDTNCKPAKNYDYRMAFAFSVYTGDGKEKQHSLIYDDSKKSNSYQLDSPNEFFVINAKHRSNFLVAYPDHVYENFFKFLDEAYNVQNVYGENCDICGNYEINKKHIVFFFLDLFEVSRRGQVDVKWFLAFWQRSVRYSALGLYSMSELQRVKHFELLCLGSHLGLHLKRRGGSELGFTNFYKFFCKYANPPPAKYTPTVGVISGCQFPLLPDVVDQHSSEHPGNWKKDCQFWIETSFEHHFSGFFESTHVLV